MANKFMEVQINAGAHAGARGVVLSMDACYEVVIASVRGRELTDAEFDACERVYGDAWWDMDTMTVVRALPKEVEVITRGRMVVDADDELRAAYAAREAELDAELAAWDDAFDRADDEE